MSGEYVMLVTFVFENGSGMMLLKRWGVRGIVCTLQVFSCLVFWHFVPVFCGYVVLSLISLLVPPPSISLSPPFPLHGPFGSSVSLDWLGHRRKPAAPPRPRAARRLQPGHVLLGAAGLPFFRARAADGRLQTGAARERVPQSRQLKPQRIGLRTGLDLG